MLVITILVLILSSVCAFTLHMKNAKVFVRIDSLKRDLCSESEDTKERFPSVKMDAKTLEVTHYNELATDSHRLFAHLEDEMKKGFLKRALSGGGFDYLPLYSSSLRKETLCFVRPLAEKEDAFEVVYEPLS